LTLATETRPTAQATIEALMFGLRRGLSCLGDRGHRDRLARCDVAAVEQIARRLRSWRDKGAAWLPAHADGDIATLLKVWRALKERELDGRSFQQVAARPGAANR
jgi:hypothetical protein